MKPTADIVKSLLNYNAETGVFTWRVERGGGRRRAGDVAGSIDGGGYRQIRVNGARYKANRLAFLYMTGEWPIRQIDHKDGDRLNDRWDNLREAGTGENARNRKTPTNNTTGFKGVSMDKKTGRFRATICHNGRWISLGFFASAIEAHKAYIAKASELFGEFARTG